MEMSTIGALNGIVNNYSENAKVQNIKSEDFNKLLAWAEEQETIDSISNEIMKEFHTPVNVVDFACQYTDDTAASYDLAMIDKSDFKGANNVVISKDILLRMSKDKNFKEKVFQSIREMPGIGGMAGGLIKSTGAVIHEDGTAGYWTEFDWGEDEPDGKKIVISKKPLGNVLQMADNQKIDILESNYMEAAYRAMAGYRKEYLKNNK